MIIRKDAIRGRVKDDLPIVFTDEKLSAYGGIELFRRFLDRPGFAERLQKVFWIRHFDGDYGSFRITLALIGMLLVGGTRLRHLRVLERDPLFLRFARLQRLPTDRTVANTLKETTSAVCDRLGDLLRDVAYDTARRAGLSRVTIDLDGTVLRTGLFAEGAERGFNPHHPKDKSYYPLTAQRKRWTRIRPGLQGFFTKLRVPKWDLTLRVAVYRKHVSRRTRKNFQLDLFDPNDGHYEYSSVATNKGAGLRTLWNFMAGRGGHEKTLGELKQHLVFDTIPTHDWGANTKWQLISALTHNVLRQFQIATTATERPNGPKRTYRWVLESLRTFRYEMLNLPAKLARPEGRTELRIAASNDTQERIRKILDTLRKAA